MDESRKMGFLGATSYVIGNIIGSGIFITPASILRNVDSIGLSLLIWVLCAVIAILGESHVGRRSYSRFGKEFQVQFAISSWVRQFEKPDAILRIFATWNGIRSPSHSCGCQYWWPTRQPSRFVQKPSDSTWLKGSNRWVFQFLK